MISREQIAAYVAAKKVSDDLFAPIISHAGQLGMKMIFEASFGSMKMDRSPLISRDGVRIFFKKAYGQDDTLFRVDFPLDVLFVEDPSQYTEEIRKIYKAVR